MDLHVVEVGAIPMNDPTLEDGAVIVKRSQALSYIVNYYTAQATAEEPDLTEDSALLRGRYLTLHALSAAITSKDYKVDDAVSRMIHLVIEDLWYAMGLDTAKYKVYSHLSMTQQNILVVVYGILYEQDGGLH